MKRFIAFVIVIVTLLITPATQAQTESFIVTFEPGTEIRQGQTALVRVLGVDLAQVRATFLGKTADLHPTNVGDWVGFLAVDMDTQPGAYTVDILVWGTDQQTPVRESVEINVLWGTFDSQSIELSYRLEPLLDGDLNAADFETLARVYNRTTPERLFTSFEQPVPGPVISFFGGFRNYNEGQLLGRHTGVDDRAITGTPISAASEGRVGFAGSLPIHGNQVVVDHGWGILTGYSHLSETLVVPGQLVRQGDTIGLVGATGRVQGPHVHFELTVNGFWVDAVQFFELNIPLPAPPKMVNSDLP